MHAQYLLRGYSDYKGLPWVPSIGMLADKTDHPIFKELVPVKDENGKYVLINFEHYTNFPAFSSGGKLLLS